MDRKFWVDGHGFGMCENELVLYFLDGKGMVSS